MTDGRATSNHVRVALLLATGVALLVKGVLAPDPGFIILSVWVVAIAVWMVPGE